MKKKVGCRIGNLVKSKISQNMTKMTMSVQLYGHSYINLYNRTAGSRSWRPAKPRSGLGWVRFRILMLFRVAKMRKKWRRKKGKKKKREEKEITRRRKNRKHLISLESHQRRDGVTPPFFSEEYRKFLHMYSIVK